MGLGKRMDLPTNSLIHDAVSTPLILPPDDQKGL
jgi:hypothetical protein